MTSAATWHDLEYSAYAADLAVWEELAGKAGGAILDLGCGTGRVALHLARGGREIWAVDADPTLLDALAARASAEGLPVHAACADVRSLELGRRFDLILAPMQLLQMVGGEAGRRAALEQAVAHLESGGRLAAAIVEHAAARLGGRGAALPDVRERDGWVYSSLPVAVGTDGGAVEIRRWRQSVSPEGSLSEEEHVDVLDALDAAALEAEAATVGLRAVARLRIPPADGYLGSAVVVLEGA